MKHRRSPPVTAKSEGSFLFVEVMFLSGNFLLLLIALIIKTVAVREAGLECSCRIKSSTRALSAERTNDTGGRPFVVCCIGLRVELDCRQDGGGPRDILASFVKYRSCIGTCI